MTGYLLDAAYVWLENERPHCRTMRDLRLPCGGKVDLAVIEDGRICGIIFWNAASDRSASTTGRPTRSAAFGARSSSAT